MMTQFPAQYLYTCALELWLLPSVDIRSKPTAGKAFLLPKVLLWQCVFLNLFFPIYFIGSSLIPIVILNKWEDVITQSLPSTRAKQSAANEEIRASERCMRCHSRKNTENEDLLRGLHPSYSAQSHPDRLWRLYCCVITAKARLSLHWNM